MGPPLMKQHDNKTSEQQKAALRKIDLIGSDLLYTNLDSLDLK